MFSTSFKIVIGYILLVGLLIGAFTYTMQQMNLLTTPTSLRDQLDHRRHITHRIISQLYDAESIGQTLRTGNLNEYYHYLKAMKEVNASIDTLETILTDTLQQARLDTVRTLLQNKQWNMYAVLEAMRNTPTDQIYQEQLDSLIAQQDSLLSTPHIRRKVITHHNSYTIHHKKKGFFKRLADVFAPGKEDSTQVSNVIQEEYTDTLDEVYSPIDTISSMITGIQHKVFQTRQKETEMLNTRISSLRVIGSGLSQRVNQLLENIEHDEQEAARTKLMQEEEIRKEFGDEVALLVDGVTKLGQLSYSKDKVEVQAENLRKMFLAMAKDIRVILIKLADRLHNMRTLQYMRPEKQQEKARETMDIYAPIAMRLGISKIKVELDDLSLKYLKPDVYYDLVEKVALRKSAREEFVNSIVKQVKQHMEDANIRAQVDGRVKHFFSIYKKMVNQDKTIDQIYDLFAVRIIVDTVKDCYAALGVIHEMYKPIPGRFKDYIAMPKANMYQSLHTTLIGPNGQPFEIQIRTFEMHKTAEYGIAAHWKYKETSDGKKPGKSEEEKLNWLRQILEWQRDMSDNREFMSLLKNDLDLFADSVYCFTPQGDVKTLPNGSTPIDFAYSVHSAVGNKMVGARVNGKLVPIEYKIKNGDRIEIITSQNSQGPSRDWLKIVKSTQAKNKITQWFKKELKEDNILKGKDMLNQYAKTKGFKLGIYTKPQYMESVMHKYGFRDWDSVLAAIGHGGLKEGQVFNKLVEAYEREHRSEERRVGKECRSRWSPYH